MKKVLTLCLLILGLLSFSALADAVSSKVYAEAQTQTVSANTLTNAAAAVIRQQTGVPVESDSLTVNYLGNPSDLTAPAGNLELAVSLPYGVRYNAPTTAVVTVSVDGKVSNTAILKFEVKLYQQVVVAARAIAKGEVLGIDNLRLERLDVGRLTTGYYTDINDIAGLLSRRDLKPGTAFSKYLIEKPIVVKRGSAVTIIARTGGIEVTAFGKALQDGYEGQMIRVQNINSQKYMAAKVTGPGTVEIMI